MIFLDTLKNLVSGLGTSKDKNIYASHVLRSLSINDLENAYRGDWLARKIIDIPPGDMTREWREWQCEREEIKAIEAEEKRLNVIGKVAKAMRLARLYGGSALIMGFGDQDPSKPAPEKIARGGLKWLHVVHRFQLSTPVMNRDIMSPWFGLPEYYEVTGAAGSSRIHPSRVIRFIGAEIPDPWKAQDGWGDSVLQHVMDAVTEAGVTTSSVASLVNEAKNDVIKIPHLSEHLSSDEYSSRLSQRFTLANQLKSMFNMTLLDSEEDFQRFNTSFAQLPDMVMTYLQIASGAADIPATRLLGRAPAGMNATGESDLTNYYDRIGADQRVMLQPAIEPLDRALVQSAGLQDSDAWYEWAPLWTPTEKEKAEIDKARAEATNIYVNSGLFDDRVLSKAVTNQLIENGTYPGLSEAVEEFANKPMPGEEPDAEDPATDPANDPENPAGGNGSQMEDAAPRTLYVRRNVKNAAEIIKWAKSQGFKTTLPASDMHVTVAFSRKAVDWMAMGAAWDTELKVPAGGPRLVEPLGDKGAVVLLFSNSELAWRHEDMKRAGASWDYEGYQPHVSITYSGEGMDLSKVEPYRGEIILGPEIFEEVVEDWDATISEV